MAFHGRHLAVCDVCGFEVAADDKVEAVGKSYHKRCFVCDKCNKILDIREFGENEGVLYCGTCIHEAFTEKLEVERNKEGAEPPPQNDGCCCSLL